MYLTHGISSEEKSDLFLFRRFGRSHKNSYQNSKIFPDFHTWFIDKSERLIMGYCCAEYFSLCSQRGTGGGGEGEREEGGRGGRGIVMPKRLKSGFGHHRIESCGLSNGRHKIA